MTTNDGRTRPVQLNRRQLLAATICVAFIPSVSMAQDKVDESDPTAMALGYKHDAASVDAAKYPQRAENMCSTCSLYTGPEGSEWGPCTIFPGKQVAAKGWCTAFAPKT